MCGIAGIVSRETLSSTHLEQVARVSGALIHRGPDGAGQFHSERVALAVRRLSIIDLATGWQPIYNEDKTLVLIANAEIYNYVELRDQLKLRGHNFRTGSDCEVIVHLFEEYGDECVAHLRGMFAFALWQSRSQRLLLARDRMGEKPLYLYERDGQLLFGSELRALVEAGAVPVELNRRAIDLYFHYQYVPEPETAIEGMRKLRPAHIMAVTTKPWRLEETCYWRMEDAPALHGDPGKLIRTELERVSELIIRADVPVGIALSGGLDSSAIAVLAARKYPGSMHAFGAGYANRPRSDERAKARALADYLGMPFHDVEIATPEVVGLFPELIGWQDDPIADISAYGYYAISRAARAQEIPVILQGQGGDELFWGYPWVAEAARQSLRKHSVPGIREYLRVSWPAVRQRRAWWEWVVSLGGLRSSWNEFRRDRLSPRERLVFYDLTPDFRAAVRELDKIYDPGLIKSLDDMGPFRLFTLPVPWPPVDVLITKLICETYLLENGIAQCDRLSMTSSVELRIPFVDFRLVEVVIGLRKASSDLGLPPKAWLKEAVKDVVPPWVLSRPKRGFQPPARAWHRALFAEHGHLLKDGALVQLGILRREAAEELGRGRYPLEQNTPLSFKALVLELWCRQRFTFGTR